MQERPKPVVIAILGGIGLSPVLDGNAVAQADLLGFRHFFETYPSMALSSSGEAVGLPAHAGGSVTAGFRTIGLGFPWFTADARVDATIENGTFGDKVFLKRLTSSLVKSKGVLHLVGLLSSSQTYAKRAHLLALLSFAKSQGISRVAVHVILDESDLRPDTGRELVEELERDLFTVGIGKVASVCGRTWGMNDDGFWDRTDRAVRAIVFGESEAHVAHAEDLFSEAGDVRVPDEEIPPTLVGESARMKDGDVMIFWNVRPLGMRQIVSACSLPTCTAYERPDLPEISVYTLTEYDRDLPIDAIFPSEIPETCVGRAISDAGLRQLRIAEAERFAHITVFLNGMMEDPFPGEDHLIVPSPAVSSYDVQPEMHMSIVSDRAIKAIAGGEYDVIFLSLSAPDLVARTGNEEATIEACRSLDKSLTKVAEATLAVGGMMIAVGDHGRAESLRDPMTGGVRARGTTDSVPCFLVGKNFEGLKALTGDVVGGDLTLAKTSGTLADIAPTILRVLGLPIPSEMTGSPLVT